MLCSMCSDLQGGSNLHYPYITREHKSTGKYLKTNSFCEPEM